MEKIPEENLDKNAGSKAEVQTYRQKCESACLNTNSLLESYLQKKSQEKIKNHPFFQAKGREYPIGNEYDYFRALLQAEKDISLEVAEKCQDHFNELAANKYAQIFKEKEIIWALYAEIKLYYPKLAPTLEKNMPFLKTLEEQAKVDYVKFKTNH